MCKLLYKVSKLYFCRKLTVEQEIGHLFKAKALLINKAVSKLVYIYTTIIQLAFTGSFNSVYHLKRVDG